MEKPKEIEKIILNENRQSQNSMLGAVEHLVKRINESLGWMKNKTGYVLTINDIRDLFYNTTDAVDRTHENLIVFMDKQLDDLNITSHIMRDNFKVGSMEVIKTLAHKLKALSVLTGSEHVYKFVIVDGNVQASDDLKEAIRNSYRNFIESESAKLLYQQHKEAAEKLNDFISFIHKNTPIRFFAMAQIADLFILGESKEIKLSLLDYERITRKSTTP